MDTVRAAHDAMLEKERAALEEVVRECMEAIHSHCTAADDPAVRNVALKADEYFSQRRAEVAQKPTLALLNGMMPPMWAYKDDALRRMDALRRPAPETPAGSAAAGAAQALQAPSTATASSPARRLESAAGRGSIRRPDSANSCSPICRAATASTSK